MDSMSMLEITQGQLAALIKPFQQDLNQRKRQAEFVQKCIRAAKRDDFFALDQLLQSADAQRVVDNEALAGCDAVFAQLREYADGRIAAYRLEFIDALQGHAEEVGLPITIDFPRFQSLKGIEGAVDFGARVTTVNGKKLKSVDPRRIIVLINRFKKQLYDRPFDGQQFIDGMHAVYATQVQQEGNTPGDGVPIHTFYRAYVLSLQAKTFFQNMEKGRFRGYSVDEFAVDLWRYYQAGVGGTSRGHQLQLRPGRNRTLWLIDSAGERRQIAAISFQG